MADVFISYSRKNKDFATILNAELEKRTIDTWVDWSDIPGGKEWEQEIKEAIEKTNAFLFIVSEASLSSENCIKELTHAALNKKRLVPIVLPGTDKARIPKPLAVIHWIDFPDNEGNAFDEAFEKLIIAIYTDWEWVTTHTEIQVLALEWHRNEKNKSYLLTGTRLKNAESWLGYNPSNEVEPTKAQIEFIQASRVEANHRQRVIFFSILLALITSIGLTIFSLIQRNLAREAEKSLSTEVVIRSTAQAIAEENEQKALRQAQISRSGELVAQANNVFNEYPQRGLLLAIESINLTKGIENFSNYSAEGLLHNYLDDSLGYPINGMYEISEKSNLLYIIDDKNDTFITLWNMNISEPWNASLILDIGKPIIDASMNEDGSVIAAYTSEEVKIWEIQNYTIINEHIIYHSNSENPLTAIKFSPDGEKLLLITKNKDIKLWDINKKSYILEMDLLDIDSFNNYSALRFSPDGLWLIIMTNNSEIILWDLLNAEVKDYTYQNTLYSSIDLEFSTDSKWLLLRSEGDEVINHLWRLNHYNSGEPVLVKSFNSIGTEFTGEGHWLSYITTDSNNLVIWDLHSSSINPRSINLEIPLDVTQINLSEGEWIFGVDDSQDTTEYKPQNIYFWNLKTVFEDNEPTLLRTESNLIKGYFSPKTKWFVTEEAIENSPYTSTKLWDLSKISQEIKPLAVPSGLANDIIFSPDERWIAFGDFIELYVWDLKDLPSTPIILSGYEQDINDKYFSKDGEWLITIGELKQVILWKFGENGPKNIPFSLSGMDRQIYSLIISDNCKWIITNEYAANGQFRIWNLDKLSKMNNQGVEGLTSTSLENKGNLILDVAISPNEQIIASVDWEGNFRVWDLSLPQPQILYADKPVGDEAYSVEISRDGKWLVVSGLSHIVKLWDLSQPISAETAITLEGHSSSVRLSTFSPNNNWLATGSRDGEVLIWDLSTQSNAVSLCCHASQRDNMGGVTALTFSPDNMLLFSGGIDGVGAIWEMEKVLSNQYYEPQILDEQAIKVQAAVFSHDGKWLATGYSDYQILLWDLEKLPLSPIQLKTNEGQSISMSGDIIRSTGIQDIVWSLDDRYLVASQSENMSQEYIYSNFVSVWDINDLNIDPMILRGPDNIILSLAISPDGKKLVAGGYAQDYVDIPVYIWDINNFDTPPLVLGHHFSKVTNVQFSPSGKWLITTDVDIQLWSLEQEALLAKSCSIVGRNFSLSEWQQYFPNESYREICPGLQIPDDFINYD